MNNNELSPITELQRGGDERQGRGTQWNKRMEDAERRMRWGEVVSRLLSLLLRIGILMRSVNECWHRWGCAAIEKQPPCPCRTAAAALHSLFHLTHKERYAPRSFCPRFFFLFVSHVHLLVIYFLFFPLTQGICFWGPLITLLYLSVSCRAFNVVFRGLYSAVANIVSPSSLEAVWQ